MAKFQRSHDLVYDPIKAHQPGLYRLYEAHRALLITKKNYPHGKANSVKTGTTATSNKMVLSLEPSKTKRADL